MCMVAEWWLSAELTLHSTQAVVTGTKLELKTKILDNEAKEAVLVSTFHNCSNIWVLNTKYFFIHSHIHMDKVINNLNLIMYNQTH